MDKLRAMEVFCAVADTGGLASAARKLGLSPPTVTRIINELEVELGTPLLHRTTRSVTLTETGATYFSDALQILEDVNAAEDLARGAQTSPTGLLRLTASVLFGQHYITPIVRDYLDLYPDVRVEAAFVDRVVRIIDEGFDVAVRIGPLPDSNLRAIRVGTVRHQICASPSYLENYGIPQQPSDLQSHRIIAFGQDGVDVTWKFANDLAIKVTPRLRFSTINACVESAKAGWGLTRALSYQIGPELEAGALKLVLTEHSGEDWPVSLVHNEGRQPSAKVRAFLDIATERLRQSTHLN